MKPGILLDALFLWKIQHRSWVGIKYDFFKK